ncbi:MAG TPA: metal-sulfur cluster assembly factor [Ramlibacter sp.]|uniref:metal-sulfur cluster assembly factor n=1 Tax=Ramlibacter sp. TaxID=1917967 RepID=UPI002ECFF829
MSATRFAYEGPPGLLPAIEAALHRVIDPEVALDIVDVGLVYGVHVAEDRVDVNVTMTSAACPVADVIVEDIEFQLDQSLPGNLKIHVELVWEPPWTPERMSARARLFMGW